MMVISLFFLQRIILSFSKISSTFKTIFALVLHLAMSSLVVVTSCPRFKSTLTPPKYIVLLRYSACMTKSIHRCAISPSFQTQWRSMSLYSNTYPGIIITVLSKIVISHCRDRTFLTWNVSRHSVSCLSLYSDARCGGVFPKGCRFRLLCNDLPC